MELREESSKIISTDLHCLACLSRCDKLTKHELIKDGVCRLLKNRDLYENISRGLHYLWSQWVDPILTTWICQTNENSLPLRQRALLLSTDHCIWNNAYLLYSYFVQIKQLYVTDRPSTLRHCYHFIYFYLTRKNAKNLIINLCFMDIISDYLNN